MSQRRYRTSSFDYNNFSLRVSSGTLKHQTCKVWGTPLHAKDTTARQGTSDDLDTWLSAVDQVWASWKFKPGSTNMASCLIFLWPLLVYESPINHRGGFFERKISQFLRRWLGLPRSLSSTALFGHEHPSCSFRLAVRSGQDQDGSGAHRKAVERAEESLCHSIRVGTVAIGRAGLGSNPKPSYSKASVKERRKLVQEEVRAEVEKLF
ncbi:hypothetical protein NFI96_020514 [Prochilodus magdalenae]|nr:hypothetical protein NFI96_020514 [Prochilodus magdalenae]